MMVMIKMKCLALLPLMAAWPAESRIRGSKSTHGKPASSRKLTQTHLMGYGGEPNHSHFPLGRCEGDCDNDNDVSIY